MRKNESISTPKNGAAANRPEPSNSKNGSAKRGILAAALEEFATHGFEGGRVDRIARRAGVNKAMIFYYFASKKNLYHTILKEALNDLIPQISRAVMESGTPERLFEVLPALYIGYFSGRRELIKMIGREMIHDPSNITPAIREIFSALPHPPSRFLPEVIAAWHRNGLISESDPVQLIFNIIPLCLFPFIAQPMVEAIMDVRISDDAEFLEKRIRSITHLLKRGMLP